MKKNFDIVCWRLTSKCNRHCPFCYRPNCEDLDKQSIFKIINKLVESGVRGFGITGGEPLLYPNISDVLEFLGENKINVCLATNTDQYNEYSGVINRCVTTIGIPIEGSTEQIHDQVRGENSLKNVINTIDRIYRESKIKMYFSTVLTKYNFNDLANIENLLSPYKDRIVYWKIYELISYKYKADFQLKDRCVDMVGGGQNVLNILGKKIAKNKIFYSSSTERSGVNFIINPDGNVIVPIEKNNITRDILVGNMLSDDVKSVFLKWCEYADFKDYECHMCALRNVCIN